MIERKTQQYFKKGIRIIFVIGVILVVLVFAAQLWVEHKTEQKLQSLVENKSGGKMKLRVEDVDVNLFTGHLAITNGRLANIDTTTEAVTYDVGFKKLSVTVGSIWPLIFGDVQVDSIKVFNPTATIVQWKKDTSANSGGQLSISREMGKMYNSLLDALEQYEVNRVVVANAAFSFINKTEPGSKPVNIDKLNLDLVRTAPAKNNRGEFVEGEQSVVLTTTDQDFYLPGNRHQIAFSSFKLQLLNERVVIDSCTIRARATDSSNNSYLFYFHQLILSGVDFEAMYQQDLLKADSVYCINPDFMMQLDPGQGTVSGKSPEEILKELAGKMEFGFIGISNAGLHLEIAGEKPKTIFNSSRDDINIQGLRINVDANKPLKMERLEMKMRDYRMLNEDSSVAYGFNTLLFNDERVSLTNFFVETDIKRHRGSIKNFSIPLFTLRGIDWALLAFEQKLKATEATLVNPQIKYIKTTGNARKNKGGLSSSLSDIDELLSLQKLVIINGQVEMRTSPATAFAFKDLHLNVETNKLIGANNTTAMVRSVNELAFSYAHLQQKYIKTTVYNAALAGTKRIAIKKILIDSKTKTANGFINNLVVTDMRYTDDTEKIEAGGLSWADASVTLKTAGSNSNSDQPVNLHVRNIHGGKTFLNLGNNEGHFISSFSGASAASVVQNNAGVSVNDLKVKNQKVQVDNETLQAKGSIQNWNLNALTLQKKGAAKLNGLIWNNASIAIETSSSGNSNQKQKQEVELTDVLATNTDISFTSGSNTFITNFKNLQADAVSVNEGKVKVSPAASINGNNILVKTANIKTTTEEYAFINSGSSFINQMNFEQIKQQDSISLSNKRIEFTTDINNLLEKQFAFQNLNLHEPILRYHATKNQANDQSNNGSKPNELLVSVDNLNILRPGIDVALYKNDTATIFKMPSLKSNTMTGEGIHYKNGDFAIKQFGVAIPALHYSTTGKDAISMKNGLLQASVSNVAYAQKSNDTTWHGTLDELLVYHPDTIFLAGNQHLAVDSLAIHQLFLSSKNIEDVAQVAAENKKLTAFVSKGTFVDSVYQYYWGDIKLANNLLIIDTFDLHPAITRDKFNEHHKFQADEYSVQSGGIALEGIGVEKTGGKYAIVASKLSVKNTDATIFRDLEPQLSSKVKPLPVDIFKSIPIATALDTIAVINSTLRYTEKNKKTRAEGTVVVSDLNGTISNLKNYNITNNDSLKILATGKLMKSANARLEVQQSYTDSLNAFKMEFWLEPTSLTIFNELAASLANVYFPSANIDSLKVRAIGREFLSFGTIDMYYNKLRIKLVKDGDMNNSPLPYDVASFLANTFIIDSKNIDDKNLVFFERLRDRSFFNYLFKIAFSGFQTAVGLKRNDKVFRTYLQKLQEHNVPDIREVPTTTK